MKPLKHGGKEAAEEMKYPEITEKIIVAALKVHSGGLISRSSVFQALGNEQQNKKGRSGRPSVFSTKSN
ncbi:MAG TPA: hypothetical protein VHV32_18735 [Candidatus Angelobacter sp.]|nr:hypothetical protein [Candidatus Angelobacter sp.]